MRWLGPSKRVDDLGRVTDLLEFAPGLFRQSAFDLKLVIVVIW